MIDELIRYQSVLSKFARYSRLTIPQIESNEAAYRSVWVLSRHQWDTMYYSTLTMLRASADVKAGLVITAKCFDAAKLCLESHATCFKAWEALGATFGDKVYANW